MPLNLMPFFYSRKIELQWREFEIYHSSNSLSQRCSLSQITRSLRPCSARFMMLDSRDVANAWSIYCSSAGRSNKSFSRVTILKMWLSNSYVYTSEFILTLWIIFCGFVKIATVLSRSYLTFIASRNLACVILGPSVSSRILQSRTLKISWSINIDETRYVILSFDNNVEWEKRFMGLVSFQYVTRLDFIFRASRFPHLEVIRRSARGITHCATIPWHWIRMWTIVQNPGGLPM